VPQEKPAGVPVPIEADLIQLDDGYVCHFYVFQVSLYVRVNMHVKYWIVHQLSVYFVLVICIVVVRYAHCVLALVSLSLVQLEMPFVS
jgi:hypothetical protein